MACQYCALDYCSGSCLCYFCGDGPGYHLDECPYGEGVDSEAEFWRRWDLPQFEDAREKLAEEMERDKNRPEEPEPEPYVAPQPNEDDWSL